jgi:HSP20 family protein
MRNGSLLDTGRSFDDLVASVFGPAGTPWPAGGYTVPTDVFHTDDELFIRMDLPGVDPEDVEVTVQENNLVINGRRNFSFDAENVRFARRGAFYGDFTQRVALGKGLDVEKIAARFDRGVLEISIPYAPEVQPKKVSIQVGDQPELSS